MASSSPSPSTVQHPGLPSAGSSSSPTSRMLGRRRFPGLGRILAFFAFLAALAFVVDALIGSGLRRIRTSKFGSLNRVMAGEVNADIIINGSSRALVHYDPRIIAAATGRSAYNLGMNGVQIDVQLAVLKAYLSMNRKPRVVIQNLESFTFKTTKRGELYDPGAYLPYLSNRALYEGLRQIDPAVWKWKYFPLYGYVVEDLNFTWVKGLLAFAGRQESENYFQGFNPRHLQWTGDFEQFRRSVGPAGVVNEIELAGIACLEEMIALCAQADITLILAYSPVYAEMQALERNRAEVFATFERLARQHSIPFWDFSGHPVAHIRDYFYNSQHLNAEGARIFSSTVADRLAVTPGIKTDGTSRTQE